MDQKYYNISYAESPFGTLNQYMTRTYSWMAAGLLVTFATALLTVTTPLFELMFSTGLVFLLSIAELVLVAVLSARVERLQPPRNGAVLRLCGAERHQPEHLLYHL